MERINQKIADLVEKNPASAKALHFLGIHFYNYSENTLGEICQKRGIDEQLVIKKLNEAVSTPHNHTIDLVNYPLDLIVEYLRHSHYIFIKDRLPYLRQLIEDYPQEDSHLIQELKTVFPEFSREFIEHVYEEEDRLFDYVLRLKKMAEKGQSNAPIDLPEKDFSLDELEKEHHQHDDEMQGIKEITRNYTAQEGSDLHYRVILETLQKFSEELKNHAKIENEILFPKAKVLEKEIIQTKA